MLSGIRVVCLVDGVGLVELAELVMDGCVWYGEEEEEEEEDHDVGVI